VTVTYDQLLQMADDADKTYTRGPREFLIPKSLGDMMLTEWGQIPEGYIVYPYVPMRLGEVGRLDGVRIRESKGQHAVQLLGETEASKPPFRRRRIVESLAALKQHRGQP